MIAKMKCSDCVFFEENSCKLGRLKVFRSVKLKDGFYIDRFCNTKRKESWAKNRTNLEKDVYNEVYTKVDIVITSDFEKNLKLLEGKKYNHIYLINPDKDYKLGPKITQYNIFFGHFMDSIIPKLTGEYILILDNVYDVDLDNLNERININLEKIAYIKDPTLINKALYCFVRKESESHEEIIQKLDSLDSKNIKTW